FLYRNILIKSSTLKTIPASNVTEYVSFINSLDNNASITSFLYDRISSATLFLSNVSCSQYSGKEDSTSLICTKISVSTWFLLFIKHLLYHTNLLTLI